MTNLTESHALKPSGGFVLVTALVFLAMVSLLTLNTIQLATHDLLLLGNVQNRLLSHHALLSELNRQRAQLVSTSLIEAETWPAREQTGDLFFLGCYISPWLPVDGPQDAPPTPSYQLYKLTVAYDGAESSSAQAVAIIAVTRPSSSCQAE